MDKITSIVKRNYELYLGSIFLTITVSIVLMNVFTRYFLKFTFFWAEEVAVGAFVWTIFLGFANAYKTRSLIGVEVLTSMVPRKFHALVAFITALAVTVLSSGMFYLSYRYISASTKVTAALEISYFYIYISILIAFALITLYSIYFLIQSFRKMFTTPDLDLEIETDFTEVS